MLLANNKCFYIHSCSFALLRKKMSEFLLNKIFDIFIKPRLELEQDKNERVEHLILLVNKIVYDIEKLAIQINRLRDIKNLIIPLSNQNLDEINSSVSEILKIFPLLNIENLPENDIDSIILNYQTDPLRRAVE